MDKKTRGAVMKPYLLQTLKEIALLGAINQKIELSSLELAKQLNTSQQTASRYLLELDNSGFITRELGIKKQLIMITESGVDILQEELATFKQIFELETKVVFKGHVVSGLGEGKFYTSQKGYVEQFQHKLGFSPYPGTLNIEIQPLERNKLRLLKHFGGVSLEAFVGKERSFGEVRCFPATINGVAGAIVVPVRSHYSTILEVVSSQCLRGRLRLHDGDDVDVIVYLNK